MHFFGQRFGDIKNISYICTAISTIISHKTNTNSNYEDDEIIYADTSELPTLMLIALWGSKNGCVRFCGSQPADRRF